MTRTMSALSVVLLALFGVMPLAAAQGAAPAPAAGQRTAPPAPAGVTPPPDYVIGPEDLLVIQFWRDEQMSGETMVRPDGMITVKLLNDIQASGLTPNQLREVLLKEATRFLEDPSVTVVVKQINSRKVRVMGEVAKQGPLPINGPLTVLQALGEAGGVTEYADKSKIVIIRTENGKQRSIPFDYEAVSKGRKLEQIIPLMPGDTVLVP